jgi:hypothetical protein
MVAAAAAGALVAGGALVSTGNGASVLGHRIAHHAPTTSAGRAHVIDYMEPLELKASTQSVVPAQPQLQYGGGIAGVGIETAPKVYIVFVGTQWGTATTVSGQLNFTKDPNKEAPYLQRFMKGLYGAKDNWSTSTTQFCQGVAITTEQCGASGVHPTHPTVSPVAGVWYDNVALGLQPGETKIRTEAVRAAQHFHNLTAASNASTQYVMVLPHGIVPPGFKTQYCAWHSSGTTAFGNIAYTQLPYLPDAGYACGKNFVNAGTAGLLDGVSIVAGHEYTETITDQFPVGGWLDSAGEENADKCSWIASGPGAAANLTLATGKFAVQSLWSNDANGATGGCSIFYNAAADQG